MNAYIVRAELAKFRRRGWTAYTKRKEYIEAMFGYVFDDLIVVSMFYPITHTADMDSCFFDDEDQDDAAEVAVENHLQMIGTIHTHPGQNTCSHASDCDLRHSLKQNEILTGTMHIYIQGGRKFSRVNFINPWEPVQVKYITPTGRLRCG